MSSTGSDTGSVSTRTPDRDLIAAAKGKLIKDTLDVITDKLNPGSLKGEAMRVEGLVFPAGCPDNLMRLDKLLPFVEDAGEQQWGLSGNVCPRILLTNQQHTIKHQG